MASDRVSRACPAVLVWAISCVSIFGRGGGRGRRGGEWERGRKRERGRVGEWESGRGGGGGGGRGGGRGRRGGEWERGRKRERGRVGEWESGRVGEWESGREQAGQAETGNPYPPTLSPHSPPTPHLHPP